MVIPQVLAAPATDIKGGIGEDEVILQVLMFVGKEGI
jgi:hypothetical protein